MSKLKQENTEALDLILEGQEELLDVNESEMDTMLMKLYPNLDQRADQEWAKMRKMLFQQKVAQGQAKSKLVDGLASRVKEKLDSMMERTVEVMVAMLQTKGVAAQFHKLEELDEESITEIFEDFELLQMLEDLEEDR